MVNSKIPYAEEGSTSKKEKVGVALIGVGGDEGLPRVGGENRGEEESGPKEELLTTP